MIILVLLVSNQKSNDIGNVYRRTQNKFAMLRRAIIKKLGYKIRKGGRGVSPNREGFNYKKMDILQIFWIFLQKFIFSDFFH